MRVASASGALEPLSLPEDLTCNWDREQLKGTHVSRLVPISLERLIHKDLVHSQTEKENRESDEGVSQAPDSALPWQDCQKRFPHRFARSGLICSYARGRPRLRPR